MSLKHNHFAINVGFEPFNIHNSNNRIRLVKQIMDINAFVQIIVELVCSMFKLKIGAFIYHDRLTPIDLVLQPREINMPFFSG